MKQSLRKYVSLINLRDLVTSVTSAVIVLAMIACDGAAGILPPVPGIGGNPSSGKASVHLFTAPRGGSRIFPGNSAKYVAGFITGFAATPSQLPQSYDAICNFQPGFLSTVPSGSLVPLGMAGDDPNRSCNFFGGQQTDGKATIFDGTLSTLVASGKTVSGAAFQCRDVDSSAAILDNSLTRAYLDPNAHQVLIFNTPVNGTPTQVQFTCSGIGTDGDPVAQIEVQFAKQ